MSGLQPLIRTTSLLAFLLATCFLHAQQIILKKIPVSEQLTSNEATDIYQDREGYIWVGTPDGAIRYDGYETRVFRNSYHQPDLLTNSKVNCFTDTDTHVWLGTNRGINLVDKKTLEITSHPNPVLQKAVARCLLTDSNGDVWVGTNLDLFCYANDSLKQINEPPHRFSVNHLYEDNSRNVWVTTWARGLLSCSIDTHELTTYPAMGEKNNPFRMCQDKQGRYWITTWGDDLCLFNPHADAQEMYTFQTEIHNINPTGIYYDMVQDDTHGYYWTLSYSGLNVLRAKDDDKVEQVKIPDFDHPQNTFEYGRVYNRIIKDRNGNLWLNSYNGIFAILFDPAGIQNHTFTHMQKEIGLTPGITCFKKAPDDLLWFNQSWYGLCLYNEETKKVFYAKNVGFNNDINAITPSRAGGMWLGATYHALLWRMEFVNGSIVIKEEIELAREAANPGRIRRLFEDSKGNLWVGTERNCFVRDARTKQWATVGDLWYVTDITPDHRDGVWISTIGGTSHVTLDGTLHINKVYEVGAQAPDDGVVTLCTDSRGDVWFATVLGRIFRINRVTLVPDEHTETLNPDGTQVMRLLSEGDNVWVMQGYRITQHSLAGINHVYSVKDENIFLSSFRFGAAFIDKGKFYAAGGEGYISIDPAKALVYPEEAKVQITDIRMNGTSLLGTASGASTHRLELPADARNLELDFSVLTAPSNNRLEYAYMLEGEDQNWNYLTNGKRTAFYNRLSNGHYTLLVKARMDDKEWSETLTRISITRLPAFYEAWYARLFYVLCTLALVWAVIQVLSARVKRKDKIRFQQELTQAKLNYFTNISHELLTPLTVISCVADDLRLNVKEAARQAGTLNSNIERLKRLLVQVLDFRKIESNHMPLNVKLYNVSGFIAGIAAANFEYPAKQKNIQLVTHIARDVWGYIDTDKLDKMLFNLLSNAIKYTPEYKTVMLTVGMTVKNGTNHLLIEVADEGIGIEAGEMKKIFTKFYNNRKRVGYESNGIGLSLTRELVTLHHGTIEVKSEPGKGTTFSIELPLDKDCYAPEEIVDAEPPMPEPDTAPTAQNHPDIIDEDKPCVLYVEDNAELRELMKSILQPKYRVVTARHGEEGLEQVAAHPVDVIICDLMMPRMDGLEFTRLIKADVETSHIPILMLTAKNTPTDQVECYKAGVESFISKPFDRNILEARIMNLLNVRQLRQQNFRTTTDINITDLNFQTADEQFLQDALACVERHLDEPEFEIPQMADELNVSRSTLRRKLKVFTDLTPSCFIRNVRLKHACKLLTRKSVAISEVAYATGFSDPKYFARCFKEEFGMSPKDFQRAKLEEEGE